ncbi:MAG: acetyl-CoA carboxylase, carboxyltransferase subunit beta [Candidatus Limiplasma sp.]|nr:acetyl-CoA carboxylase, carboxyltransferase subunit beta [Candidatus Limiplasma sp.]
MLAKSLFRKPKNELEGQGAIPRDPGVSCPGCKKQVPSRELAQNLWVCPRCGHHLRMGARGRIDLLCDPGSFQERDGELESRNALDFPGYEEKLETARRESGEKEAVITGTAAILGEPCAFFAMEPAFMMGSMGSMVGEKLTRLFEHAAQRRLPVVGCTVSGGARIQEGILSLMQMAKVSAAVKRHSDGGNLYIALLTDPTTGGVAASFAMEADIILAEPGALIGFAGPRVIEQTIRQKLPAGFQRAEFQLKKGFVDHIAPRNTQRELVALLLSMHGGRAAHERV